MEQSAFVGLDGEMTGSDIGRGHRLIQVGAAANPLDMFCCDVGWPVGTFAVDPRALTVTGFDLARIHAGPPVETVDASLCDWLTSHGFTTRRRAIPIGFNVAGFDMPFVRDVLPRASRLLSRRSVDLNAVCFTLAAARIDQLTSLVAWKRRVKNEAEQDLTAHGIPANWHNAGYDSLVALVAWRWVAGRLSALR